MKTTTFGGLTRDQHDAIEHTTAMIADEAITSAKIGFDTHLKVADITTTSNVDYVQFDDLDVNAAGAYLLLAKVKNPLTAGVSFQLFINNDTTAANYYSQILYASGASVGGGRNNYPEICYANTGESNVFRSLIFRDANGRPKAINQCSQYETTSLNTILTTITHVSTFTNITSLRIQASTTGGIGANSHFILYRVRK